MPDLLEIPVENLGVFDLAGPAPANILADDAAHGWEWWDPIGWANWNLPYPFSGANHAGVDLTDDRSLPTHGWELHVRRILTTDGLRKETDATEAVSRGQKYFALYNVRSGVMRHFTFVEGTPFPSDRIIIKSSFSQGNAQTSYPNHSLFNHIGPISKTNADVRGLAVNELINVVTQISSGWIVVDLPLAYDPRHGYGEQRFYLNTSIISENVQALSIEGTIDGTVTTVNGAGNVSQPIDDLIALGGDIGLILSGVSKNAAGLTNLGEDLQRLGAGALAGPGNAFYSLGASILTGASPIANIYAGTQIVQSIMNFGKGSGGATVSLIEGALSLKGSIKDEGFRNFSAVLIHEATNAVPSWVSDSIRAATGNTANAEPVHNPFDETYFYKKHGQLSLGVFSLARCPKVTLWFITGAGSPDPDSHGVAARSVAYRMLVSLDEPIMDLIRTNPSWNTTITRARAQIVFVRPKTNWGGLVLAEGIKRETEPVKSKSSFIFHPSFDAAVPGQSIPYITSDQSATSNDAFFDNVLVRILFELAHPDAAEPMQVALTYSAKKKARHRKATLIPGGNGQPSAWTTRRDYGV